MKKIVLPLLVYLIVCIIVVFIPASEGYNSSWTWKLLIGQILAIPISLIVLMVTIYVSKKPSHG